jgi:DNA-binding NtrC family response regulator
VTTTTQIAAKALLLAGRSDAGDLEAVLRGMGFTIVHVDGAKSLGAVRDPVALCLVDLRENGEALRVTRAVRAQHPQAIVIGVADPVRPAASAEAIRAGVFDVLPRPLVPRDLEALIANAREQAAIAVAPQRRASEALPYGIVGTSPAMRLVMDLVSRAAAARCGITISGERGTGREMIARAILAHGPNPDAPFVKFDCASPTPEDVELHLFGIIVKKFTGAVDRRALERLGPGSKIEEAAGGILFLENLAEMPARVQSRLVRVLRDREATIDGGSTAIALDVRPIAAVDSSINAALEEGTLRADLHERLSLIQIDVPAFRQRREDIPVLATHFLKELCRKNGQAMKSLTRPALTMLAALPWRGNAPELKALLERLILLVPHGLIRLEDVLAHTQLEGTIGPTGVDATLRKARARFERDYIAAVLQHHHGRIADAARVLGIQRTNLYRKMRRLNLMRPKALARDW